jgi:hypothetical protein
VHQVGQPCSNHPSLWDLFNRKGAFFPTEFIFWSTPPKMTVLKRPLNSIRRVDPVIYFSVIVFLLSFVSFDVYIRKYSVPAIDPCFSLSSDADALHDAIVSNTLKSEDAQHICSMLNQRNYQEDKHCGSILGHLPSKDAWSLKEGRKTSQLQSQGPHYRSSRRRQQLPSWLRSQIHLGCRRQNTHLTLVTGQ